MGEIDPEISIMHNILVAVFLCISYLLPLVLTIESN